MKPLSAFPVSARRELRGVLFDIDDTLTTEGRLTAVAYAAMERLKNAGLLVVPITGRPAGWCDHFARMWPVDAVVGENGAFYFRYDHAEKRMHRRYHDTTENRATNWQRLIDLGAEITETVPGCSVSADQSYRETDLAIDFREDVPSLDQSAIDQIVELMNAAGMTAKISSIHVNGWFGDYDKLTMTRSLFSEMFEIDLEADKERYVFCGDSPNDQPAFAFFPNAVGVANVRGLADQLTTPPAYVTEHDAGDGFAELVDFLLGP